MQPEKVFKRYDVRGKYPEELDEEFVEIMGKAVGKFSTEQYNRKVVVCRDNKESSKSLKSSLIEGIRSKGADIIDIGVGPTDYAAFHAQKEKSIGVQVTSSHMPLEFNGLKFLYPEGNGFLNEDLNILQEYFKENKFPEDNGTIKRKENAKEEYLSEIINFLENFSPEEEKTVVVDSLGGSTKEFLPEVLERIGFDVIEIGKDREGIYRDPPNPEPSQLSKLKKKTDEKDAYIGIATDLDGDRLQIYFDGEWISGDDLFSVYAQLFGEKVVASVDTSKKLEEFADVEYTRVGDPFVIKRMIDEGASLSGEPNGHYCFSNFVNYNSGTLAGALSASINLEELLSKVSKTFQEKRNLEYEDMDSRDKVMERFKKEVVQKLEIESTIDGVKFLDGDSSVLVRPSGSSPKIRIKSEAETEEMAKKSLEKAVEILGKE